MLHKLITRSAATTTLILSIGLLQSTAVMASANPPLPPRPLPQPIVITTANAIYSYKPNVDTAPKLIAAGHGISDAHMSPDQKSIVYTELLPNNATQIFKMTAAGINVQQLTFPDAMGSVNYLPEWSPDGKRIVFIDKTHSQDNGVWSNVYTMRADGSDLKNLTNIVIRPGYFYPLGYGRPSFPTYGAGGKTVFFNNCCIVLGLSQVSVSGVPPTGGSGLQSFRNITSGALSSAESPNGATIAYIGFFGQNSLNLYTIDPDGTNKKLLVDNVIITPAWAPDSSQLLYARGDTVYSLHPDGSGQAQLLTVPEAIQSIAWN